MTELPLVIVTWLDAWGDATTPITIKDAHETNKPMEMHTIGWLIYQDEEGVKLVTEVCADGTFRGQNFIPAGMVRTITPYTLAKPRKKKNAKEAEPATEG